MKNIFIPLIALTFSIFLANEAIAISPAMDWDWYFTEVWDDEGNLLARNEDPTSDPLIFNIAPDTFMLRLYGTIVNNQGLDSANIDFVNTHTFAEKIGEGSLGFFNIYNIQLTTPGKMDRLLPFEPGEHGPFWFADVYLKDANSPAGPGTYRVYDSGLDIYDLTEPLNEFGNRTLYGIDVSNEVRWNVGTEPVIPEPATMFLIALGAILIKMLDKNRKAY